MNILGSPVFDQNDITIKGNYSSRIDVSTLPDGVYYLTLSGEITNVSRKIVIRH
jgi:hypothetical protein